MCFDSEKCKIFFGLCRSAFTAHGLKKKSDNCNILQSLEPGMVDKTALL